MVEAVVCQHMSQENGEVEKTTTKTTPTRHHTDDCDKDTFNSIIGDDIPNNAHSGAHHSYSRLCVHTRRHAHEEYMRMRPSLRGLRPDEGMTVSEGGVQVMDEQPTVRHSTHHVPVTRVDTVTQQRLPRHIDKHVTSHETLSSQ
jgi:hypothetical protein